MTVEGRHIFGIDENVFAFSVFSLILAAVWLGLRRGGLEEGGEGHAPA